MAEVDLSGSLFPFFRRVGPRNGTQVISLRFLLSSIFCFHKCFAKQESRMLTMAFNLALGKQRYVGLHGSEASLAHIVSSRPPGLQELGRRGSWVSVGLRPPWFT